MENTVDNNPENKKKLSKAELKAEKKKIEEVKNSKRLEEEDALDIEKINKPENDLFEQELWNRYPATAPEQDSNSFFHLEKDDDRREIETEIDFDSMRPDDEQEDDMIHLRFEKDAKDFLDMDSLSAENDLGSHIESYRNRKDEPFDDYINSSHEEEALDNWTLKDILKPYKEKDNFEIEEVKQASPVGDTVEGLESVVEKQPVSKPEVVPVVEIKKELPYKAYEFKEMKDFALYQIFLNKHKEMYHLRPKDKQGNTPTDEKLLKSIAENDLRTSLTDAELFPKIKDEETYKRFIMACRDWYVAAKKLEGEYKPHPVGPDGKARNFKDIKEMAQEYFDFKDEDPQGFMEMQFELVAAVKIESEEWKRGTLTFTETMFNGKREYQCKKLVTNRKGNEVEVTYVTTSDPKKAAPLGVSAEYTYSVVDTSVNPNNNKQRIEFIKLHFPMSVEDAQLKKAKSVA